MDRRTLIVHPDCRHYRGDLPCGIGKVCWDCDEFAPWARRHLIVKRGAMGDALRTTPLLHALKAESDCEITWIADADSCEVLRHAEKIDRLLPWNWESAERLGGETFDRVYSLEKDAAAAALAARIRARERIGFGFDPSGRIVSASPGYDSILRLGIDDEEKFRRNERTVPQMTLEGCGFPWSQERYDFRIPDEDVARAGEITASWGARWIALNVGCGPRWPSKAWPEASWVRLARILGEKKIPAVALGGAAERPLLARLARAGVADGGGPGGAPYSVGLFTALLARAGAVVTADTLGLHLAIAAGAPVVALFCSTTPREIEFYGRGCALASDEGPCYNARCSKYPGCFEKVRPEEVAAAIGRWA